MMVTWVRGHFKDIHGTLEFDPENPAELSAEMEIETRKLWTGVPERDAHLRSADFFDVENHPKITFQGGEVELIGENEFKLKGDLTIRGVTKRVTLDVRYLGRWKTPYWVGGVTEKTFIRAGAVARTRINRHDFGVSWQDTLDKGGIVVGNDVHITIDVEAMLELV